MIDQLWVFREQEGAVMQVFKSIIPVDFNFTTKLLDFEIALIQVKVFGYQTLNLTVDAWANLRTLGC